MAPRWSRFRASGGHRLARVCALSLLAAAACTNRESLATPYDLRWVGTLTPEAGRCQPSTRTTMTMVTRDRSITFAPSNGVLILHGAVGADGTVHAAFDATGAGHKPFPLRFTGTLRQRGVSGTYTTPICRAHVALHPAEPIPRMLFAPGNVLGIGQPRGGPPKPSTH